MFATTIRFARRLGFAVGELRASALAFEDLVKLRILALAAALVLPGTAYAQTTVYWDTNSTTAGSSAGTTASGTWDATLTADWSTSSAGTSATNTWNSVAGGNKIAVFSAGNNTTGASAITLSGAVGSVAGLTFEEGATTISGGTTLTFSTPATLNVSGGASAAISSVLAGSSNLTKAGNGTLTLSGANTFTGSLTLNAGILRASTSTQALGNGAATLVLNSGTLELADNAGAGVNYGRNTTVTGNTTIYSDRNTGGAGTTQTLGTLSIAGQTLSVTAGGNATSGTAGVTFGTTTLTGGGGSTFSVANTASATTALTLGAVTNGSTNTSATTLTKSGNGTLTLGSVATNLNNGTAINITGGTLNSNNATALGALANVTLSSGATLALGASQTVGSLNGSTGTVSLVTNNLTVGAANDLTSSYGGIVTGSGVLTKAGNGTLTLSGNSTFTGATNITVGTLKLGATGTGTNTPLGTTAAGTAVTAGAALDLAGFTLGTAEGLTLNGTGVRNSGALTNSTGSATWSGTVALGSASTIGGSGNISIAGTTSGNFALTKDGTGNLAFTAANSTTSTVTVNRGTVTLSGGGTLTSATGYTLRPAGTLTLDNTATNNTNRLTNGTGLTANGGTFNFTHSVDTAAYSETIGALTLNSGGLNINLSAATGAGSSIFTVSSITRNTGSSVLFSGTGLGASNDNQFIMTTAPAETNNILPWAVITTDGGTTYNLAKHDGNGTSIGAFSGYEITAQTGWAAADNVRPSSTANATLSNNRTANALVLDNAINVALNSTANRSLTLTSGAILQTGGSSSINANGTGDVTLAFGGTQAIITTIGDLTLNRGDNASQITGTAGVVKTGPGTFTNNGGNANTGALVINDGTWRAVTLAAAVSGGGVTANKGTLALASDASTTFTNTNTSVNGDFTFSPDRATPGSGAGLTHTLGTLTVNNGVTVTIADGSNVTSGTIGLTFGAVTIGASNATFNNTDTTLTLGAISAASGFNFTVTGAGNTNLTGVIGTSTGSLTKTGSGTLTLSNVASTFSGGTILSGGITNFTALNNLGTGAITMDGGTLQWATGSTVDISARTVTLTGNSGTFDTNGNNVTLSTAGIGNNGSGGFTKTGGGTLTLSGNSTFTGNINVQQGTYVAGHGSALGLGTGTHSVTTGAALGLSGGISVSNNSATISIAGNGVSSSGALYNVSGSNTLNANTSVSAAARIGSAAGTLTLGQSATNFTAQGHTQPNDNSFITLGDAILGSDLIFSGAGNIVVNSRIRDYAGQTPGMSFSDANTIAYKPVAPTTPGNVTIEMASGSASVTYQANANSYTGTTFVKSGTLILNTYNNTVAPHDTVTDSFHAINGPLVIGNGSSTATVQMFTIYPNEAIAINTPVTLYSDGTLNLNGASTTIDTLTFITGGTVLPGASGTLFLNNNVFFNSTANGQTATIGSGLNNGTLSLELNKAAVTDPDNGIGATRTFTITPVDGGSTATLTVNSVVARGDVVKEGNGTLVFAGNNTYLGTTTVNDGILRATRGDDGSFQSALGSADGTDARGTTVANSASLQLSGGITLSREKLNLNGDGHNGGGALQNLSGNNTWGNLGNINLVTNSRINSDADTLTITSNLTSTGNDKGLTVGGVGNSTISGQINTGSGSSTTLTKDGNGILTLSGSNGYQGLTTIQAGIVVAANDNALGSTLAGTQVDTNAELRLSGGITIPGEALTLNGTGYAGGGTGALRNVLGSNTYQGAITINAANTRINSDIGTMTLTGGISTGGNAFVVGGAGNTAQTGAVGGLGALTKDGAGTASFSNVTGLGNITINAGTLTFSGSSTTGSTVTSNTGTTNFNGASATVGQVNLLNTSTINVSASTTLNTAEFASASNSTLDIASGGTVVATYTTGNTFFSGNITGAGTFKVFGTGQVTFNEDINNPSLSVWIGGTSIGTNLNRLTFTITDTADLVFGTLRITGDTILDFGNSSASTLTSANLLIDSGVLVTVQNWISLTDFWKVTTSFSQTSGPASVPDALGVQPQNQITFTGFSNNATSWITVGAYPSYFDKEIRPVPEPSTYGAIFLSSCFAFLGYRRYRARVKM